MTNITKEINNYQQFGSKSVLEKLNQEQNEIKEKIHIINVLTVISALKDILNDKEFTNYKADYIVVNYYRDNDGSSQVEVKFKDEGGEELSPYDINDKLTPLANKVLNIFKLIEANSDFFQPSYANHQSEEQHQFKLDNEGIDEMKKEFLNDKLQASISYAMLNNHLPEGNKVQSLKVKI